MKVELCGFDYRFWSGAVPRLDRFAGRDAPDRLESVTDEHDRELVLRAAEAIERYVAASCVAVGILMLLALEEPEEGEVAYAEFKRTPKAGEVSVRTMRAYLRDRVFGAIAGMPGNKMMGFIRERTVGEGGYRPQKERGEAEKGQKRAA